MATFTPSITPSPTLTLTPSITPLPTVSFQFDNWTQVDIPDSIRKGISSPMLAFLNTNDKQTIANLSTAEPPTNVETLYYTSPTSANSRTPILKVNASTGNQVWIAPSGNAIAYFKDDPDTTKAGLYILDIAIGLSGRILAIPSLVQRGIASKPAWLPDGSRLAIALAHGYDMDIFSFARDGSDFQNMTNHPAYDFWPTYSPDGRYLMFVSDRAKCPSRVPGDSEACDADGNPPSGGNIYLLELSTKQLSQLSDQWVTEPPHWLNARRVVFTVGDQADLLNPQRSLWIADVTSGQAQEARFKDSSGAPVNLAESWSADGSKVIFQNATTTGTEIVVMTADGTVLQRVNDLNFARFSMSAAWSSDGSRLAIGGVNGQCPYGIRVFDNNFQPVARGNPPPSMCDPIFSKDGQMIAFTGVNPRIDGRVDVYIANNNGFGAVNLTSDLRGQIKLLGWIEP
jgi:Tol biopolymer transport system component